MNFQGNVYCYRLYIGNGNWINLSQETTRDLQAIYEKGVATRFELAPGVAIDILPNDVDCNSKNTDLPMLMRADLSVDPDKAIADTSQALSSYIKELLEKQGIIDVFPPTKPGNPLPSATAIATHRHLSMVPTPIGMSRRTNRANSREDKQETTEARTPSTHVLSPTAPMIPLAKGKSSSNETVHTVTDSKRKKPKRQPKKSSVVHRGFSTIMTRAQQRHSRMREEKGGLLSDGEELGTGTGTGIGIGNATGTGTGTGTTTDTGMGIDISMSVPCSSFSSLDTRVHKYLCTRLPATLYPKVSSMTHSSPSMLLYSPAHAFKHTHPSHPRSSHLDNDSDMAIQQAIYYSPSESSQQSYQHPFHALPSVSLFTSSLSCNDYGEEALEDPNERRTSMNFLSNLSPPSLTPTPSSWIERDLWGMPTNTHAMKAPSGFNPSQTPVYPFSLHHGDITGNSPVSSIPPLGMTLPTESHRYDLGPTHRSSLAPSMSPLYNEPSFFRMTEHPLYASDTYRQEYTETTKEMEQEKEKYSKSPQRLPQVSSTEDSELDSPKAKAVTENSLNLVYLENPSETPARFSSPPSVASL
ncbi:hypothetical protein BDF14DRAFT_1878501 [Spinellus fusiger]|nr:hypothetical protein BDF14DRAFT_1878501 [Spinellus fusiger]